MAKGRLTWLSTSMNVCDNFIVRNSMRRTCQTIFVFCTLHSNHFLNNANAHPSIHVHALLRAQATVITNSRDPSKKNHQRPGRRHRRVNTTLKIVFVYSPSFVHSPSQLDFSVKTQRQTFLRNRVPQNGHRKHEKMRTNM